MLPQILFFCMLGLNRLPSQFSFALLSVDKLGTAHWLILSFFIFNDAKGKIIVYRFMDLSSEVNHQKFSFQFRKLQKQSGTPKLRWFISLHPFSCRKYATLSVFSYHMSYESLIWTSVVTGYFLRAKNKLKRTHIAKAVWLIGKPWFSSTKPMYVDKVWAGRGLERMQMSNWN